MNSNSFSAVDGSQGGLISKDRLISIIVIIYKVAPFLRDCLESIAAQTYKNIEVVLVVGHDENGDYFGCREIAEEFAGKDERFRLIFCEAKGAGDARNRGLDSARGDLIGWVDGDDYIEPDMFEKLEKNLSDTDSDVSICAHFKEYPNETEKPRSNVKGRMVLSPMDVARVLLGFGDELSGKPDFFFHSWDKLFRSEIFKDLRYPTKSKLEDRYTIGDIFLKEGISVVYTGEPLYHFRIRSDSLSKDIDASDLNIKADHEFCRKLLLKFPGLKYECDRYLLYGHITSIQNILIKQSFWAALLPLFMEKSAKKRIGLHKRYLRSRYGIFKGKHRRDLEQAQSDNPRIGKKLRLKLFLTLNFPAALWLVTYIGKKQREKVHAEKFHI